ncbi:MULTISPECIES: DUF2513 domain-containing protein [unclassified Variovorax]|uniref:DUF2513 domain-containing protein n=1 Tax=unclassified Variovorax TaxID=663243 RepID=UPI00076DD24C|nr:MULTISPECIES: DUF2513 domain-containing protein [unclassified Variovorax]KWT73954.1 hypothetical protein APY03_5805 [Variovorax sp. WDL1]PNG52290.1 hypothetical protein CHC07_04662 [Variovorax sp. B4]PNG54830.1 hypothetical protein CHC06_03628 [Variovorax sp. B2]VTV15838.1 hypothetical protein WDL1CHR_06202 [Variovorax sp. WDL1]
MKRDWDTMRSVLLEVESMTREKAFNFEYRAPIASDDPEAIRAVHAFMLEDHGYLKGIRAPTNGDDALLSPELTMAGADLLDSIRSQTVWDKMKEVAKARGVAIGFDSLAGLGKIAIAALLEN